MSKKRLSLAEVMSEDEQRSTAVVAPAAVKVAAAPAMSVVATPPPAPSVAPVVAVAPVAQASANAEVVMEKLSVTLPLEMHEQLLDMSRARRRAKEPYQLSQIVREAMGAWLAANAPRE